jgi:hypothetical protein
MVNAAPPRRATETAAALTALGAAAVAHFDRDTEVFFPVSRR